LIILVLIMGKASPVVESDIVALGYGGLLARAHWLWCRPAPDSRSDARP
jgi:hypothetical protein